MRDKRPDVDDALDQRAEELKRLREAEHDTAFAGDMRETTGELSVVDQHPADVADVTYQRELQETTQQILGRELEQVEEAKRLRAEGKYGVCQNCGRKISPDRLAARPGATLCIDCQRALEERRPG